MSRNLKNAPQRNKWIKEGTIKQKLDNILN